MGSDIWLEMYANSAIKIMTERKKEKRNIYIYIYNNGLKDRNFNLDKRLRKAVI